MNNFSKAFTIATIFVGLSIYAADQGSIERYEEAQKITLVKRKKFATLSTTYNPTTNEYTAKETAQLPWCNSLTKQLENPKGIFEKLNEELIDQENKKKPGIAIKGSED